MGNYIVKALKFIREHSAVFICSLAAVYVLIGILVGVSVSKKNGDPLDDQFQTADLIESDSSSISEDTSDTVGTDAPDLEPEIPDSAAETTSGERKLTLSEMEIPDTSWAYYIVNRSNPVPDGFEDDIEFKGVFSNGQNYYLDARAADFAECMINDAADDGVTLLICSAYRSYERQTSNFENRLRSYASAKYSFANAYELTAGYIAVPGTSEHHTGLAVDFVTPGYMYLDDGFEDTDAYKWLAENSYKYGFILRYPSDKSELTGINYEPWHFRFIGFEHAEKIYNSGLCLEEYMELDSESDPSVVINPLEPLLIPAVPAWYQAYLTPAPKPNDIEAESESESETDTNVGESGATASESVSDETDSEVSDTTYESVSDSTDSESAETSEYESDSDSTSDGETRFEYKPITEIDLGILPSIPDEIETEAESTDETESETVTDTESETETESATESETMSESGSETEAVSESESEAVSESESESVSESDTEVSDVDDTSEETDEYFE